VLALDRAFRLTGHPAVSFVGAGGKTSALAAMARAQAPCFAAATSHLGDWQTAFATRHVVWPAEHEELPPAFLTGDGILLATGPPDAHPQRLSGIGLRQAAILRRAARDRGRPLFIEADGSRGLPLKAPAPHEPPIPDESDLVVIVAGLSGLGRPLDARCVHRPDRFAAIARCAAGDIVTAAHLARVLGHPEGGLKNIPSAARRIVLLNQADTPDLRERSQDIARLVLPQVDAVVVSSLQPPEGDAASEPAPAVFAVHERIAGVVLAAGSSTRLGRPKQLLDYQGRPFVRAVSETALAAGLSPVTVVTGDHAGAVAAAVGGLPVEIVQNPDWREGQTSSIRAAIAALPDAVGGAVFLLADQPHLPAGLISGLIAAHARDLPLCVAPSVDGVRTSPTLFDRSAFPPLLALRGDTGGRSVIASFSRGSDGGPCARLVPWSDPRILLDVDTEEDYQRLLSGC
jgi:molybdenum cofactor cytidylyltransferase